MEREICNMGRRSNLKLMWQLSGLVKPLLGYMILAVLMGLFGHIFATFIAVMGGYAILSFVQPETYSFGVSGIFITAAVMALLRGAFRYGEQTCNHFIAFKLLAVIRDKVFGALRRLCPAKLEGRDKGDLIAVITSDIELLEVFYAHTISPCAIAVLFSAVLCIYLGSFHIVYAGIALAAYVVVGIVIPVVTSRVSSEDGVRFRAGSGELSAFVLDSLRGICEILQYGMGEKRLSQMNQKTDELAEVEKTMKGKMGNNAAVTNVVIWMFDFLLLMASAYLYSKGSVGFGKVLLPVLAFMGSFGPVVALANLGSTLGNTFAAGNRVMDILEEEPVVNEVTGNHEVTFEGICAQNVDFSYDETQVLDNFSLEVPKSKIVGITGRSGSGKSTFLKLLMRFWDADAGKINISDTDIRQINTSNLRNIESFVTQETHLFGDSIFNNLRVAKEDATLENMQEACKKASVHDAIMSFPKGYDTPVGELGDFLSGGERQRIGLARAFLHDSKLMLLDEPTSNLDSLNEAVILKSIKEAGSDKTVILVSHRKSTMGIADITYSVE
ncbi:MAG: amino acid ABC transporter ATP-binding/permease protein [Bacteroides sp.]